MVRREQQFGVLGGQARAQRLVVAQHRGQVLGLLAQLLHLLPQSSVFLLQVLALLGGENQDISVEAESDPAPCSLKSPAWLARLMLGIIFPVHPNIAAGSDNLASDESNTI